MRRLSEAEEKNRITTLEAHDYDFAQAARFLDMKERSLQNWWRLYRSRIYGGLTPKSPTSTRSARLSGIRLLRVSLQSCRHMLDDPAFEGLSPLADRRLSALRAELDYALSLVTPEEPEKVVEANEHTLGEESMTDTQYRGRNQ